MKRYLAFYGSLYYPSGGINDFLGDYNTKDEAIKAIAIKLNEKYEYNSSDEEWYYAWAHIYDSRENAKVWSI